MFRSTEEKGNNKDAEGENEHDSETASDARKTLRTNDFEMNHKWE